MCMNGDGMNRWWLFVTSSGQYDGLKMVISYMGRRFLYVFCNIKWCILYVYEEETDSRLCYRMTYAIKLSLISMGRERFKRDWYKAAQQIKVEIAWYYVIADRVEIDWYYVIADRVEIDR